LHALRVRYSSTTSNTQPSPILSFLEFRPPETTILVLSHRAEANHPRASGVTVDDEEGLSASHEYATGSVLLARSAQVSSWNWVSSDHQQCEATSLDAERTASQIQPHHDLTQQALPPSPHEPSPPQPSSPATPTPLRRAQPAHAHSSCPARPLLPRHSSQRSSTRSGPDQRCPVHRARTLRTRRIGRGGARARKGASRGLCRPDRVRARRGGWTRLGLGGRGSGESLDGLWEDNRRGGKACSVDVRVCVRCCVFCIEFE
jgi:hypothetical protein